MKLHDDLKTVVMVIDDEVDSIRMVSDALEAAGMTVLVALEGNQALTISQNITPDVVLMDALMPHMDGFETCRRLKENPAFSDTPIIFMTGLSDTEHVVMGLKAGGVDYVTKPIDIPVMLARMDVHLTNARMAGSARNAMDTAGQQLFAVDSMGRLIWATPEVRRHLPHHSHPELEVFQSSLAQWLERKPEPGHSLPLSTLAPKLSVEFLALVASAEYLLRLISPKTQDSAAAMLRERYQLTGRESDVLFWIANGKTNREIGQILDMSPRTVNKHLEQIYRKLGVENRTAAAVGAIRVLSR